MAKTPVTKPVDSAVAKPKTIAGKAAPAEKPAVAKPVAAKPALRAKPAAVKSAAKPAAPLANGAPVANGAAAKPVPRAGSNPAADSKAKSVAAPKEKVKKPKLVRDSFTMPETEYQVLADVKKACLKNGVAVKKSELLRVGVALIRNLDVASLTAAVAALPPLKAGRPKKDK